MSDPTVETNTQAEDVDATRNQHPPSNVTGATAVTDAATGVGAPTSAQTVQTQTTKTQTAPTIQVLAQQVPPPFLLDRKSGTQSSCFLVPYSTLYEKKYKQCYILITGHLSSPGWFLRYN